METKTISEQRVINLQFVPRNSAGRLVTYPVKGTLIRQEKAPGKRQRTEYCIWSIDGKRDVVWGHYSEDDIIEFPAEFQALLDTEAVPG